MEKNNLMGSIDGFAKGQQPMLDRIKAHNATYNLRAEAISRSAPLWRKLLALLPNPKAPLHNWQHRQKNS